MKPAIQRRILLPALLILMSLFLVQCVWEMSAAESHQEGFSADKVNLALRRTAHQLLMELGDEQSAIPPVERVGEYQWRIQLADSLDYLRLSAILDESLKIHNINQIYEVSILRCSDEVIILGYHQLDIKNDNIPCLNRENDEGCSVIQLSFLDMTPPPSGLPAGGWAFVVTGLIAMGYIGYFYLKNQKEPETESATLEGWISFGNSRIHTANLALVSNGSDHKLTFREAKLLTLFANHPNAVLERDTIQEQVWADEGVIVGRSLDVFVSRLRKLLKDDPSIKIAAVHGVGYRLEVLN